MHYIEKGQEPDALIEYKKTPGVSFKNMNHDVRSALKEALLVEQGYICCYCDQRIEHSSNTILEHILCQEDFTEFALSYDNILASCDGGQNDRNGKKQNEKKRFPSHCDNKKGNKILELSPLCLKCEEYFAYDEDGRIYGQTTEADNAISILALDCSTINHRRKSAFEAYKLFKDTYTELSSSEMAAFWQKKLEYNSEKDIHGKYPEYCFAVRYYINNYCI